MFHCQAAGEKAPQFIKPPRVAHHEEVETVGPELYLELGLTAVKKNSHEILIFPVRLSQYLSANQLV
jgi:hypothetical protein